MTNSETLPANQPEIEKRNYKVLESEKGLVHLLITTKTHNPQLKRYETNSFVQKFPLLTYKASEKAGVFKQYDAVEILHHPEIKTGSVNAGSVANTATNTGVVQKNAKWANAAKTYYDTLGVPPDEDATVEEMLEAIDETLKQTGNGSSKNKK